MERFRQAAGEGACSSSPDMFEHVTQITRYHQLADVYGLQGDECLADLCRDVAVMKGIQVIALTETNKEHKQALAHTLSWLQGRDYEMHKSVEGTLEHAQAKIDMARKKPQI